MAASARSHQPGCLKTLDVNCVPDLNVSFFTNLFSHLLELYLVFIIFALLYVFVFHSVPMPVYSFFACGVEVADTTVTSYLGGEL